MYSFPDHSSSHPPYLQTSDLQFPADPGQIPLCVQSTRFRSCDTRDQFGAGQPHERTGETDASLGS